jgi:hypothetical protein
VLPLRADVQRGRGRVHRVDVRDCRDLLDERPVAALGVTEPLLERAQVPHCGPLHHVRRGVLALAHLRVPEALDDPGQDLAHQDAHGDDDHGRQQPLVLVGGEEQDRPRVGDGRQRREPDGAERGERDADPHERHDEEEPELPRVLPGVDVPERDEGERDRRHREQRP